MKVSSFCLFKSLIIKGFSKDISRNDVWDMDEEDKCSYLSKKFEKKWLKNLNKFNKKIKESGSEIEMVSSTFCMKLSFT
jgi:hypothetical protein